MAPLDEIIEKLSRNRDEIKKFGVTKLGIFGSVVRGEATDESDIDFLVQLENETFRSYMGLIFFLEELLGRKIDLVIQHTIKERLKDKILREVQYVEGF